MKLPRVPAAAVAWALAALLVASLAGIVVWEARTSTLQAHFLAAWARELRFEVRPGASADTRYPQGGPFDERAGYTRIAAWIEQLTPRDWSVTAQARQSPALVRFIERGLFPPYPEKTQTGLSITDCRRETLFSARFPQLVYPDFDAIAPLLANTLTFVENRELLAPAPPRKNPAVEWERLGRAALDQAIKWADPAHPAAGGSTLATQLEKFRHSPEGRTGSVAEKARQIVSASVRAYQGGEQTGPVRQRILLDYVNSLPLGAQRGHGEVIGMLDGLSQWFGADAAAANEALRRPAVDARALANQALALRQVLSLLIAQRRPSFFLGVGQDQLAALTDSYLRLMGDAGVIEPRLRAAALRTPLVVREGAPGAAAGPEVRDRKAAHLMRVQLASLLDTPRLYDLDRLDLSTASTLDGALQESVTALLRGLRAPQAARAAGLIGPQLLERGDPQGLAYSFTLYERDQGINRLRVQTDNLDQPFDINTGAKLELGSTAKLRTLASYLEIVAGLHQALAPLSPTALRQREVASRDPLARWAVDYLSTAPDRSLQAMLHAAMARRYSASPAERFFTGGGVHTFSNFDARDDGKTLTVQEAFRDSVNLVFIRLMRDVVQHHVFGGPRPAQAILAEADHPERAVLLARFADREGGRFIRDFYDRLAGAPPDEALERLLTGVAPTPVRLAVIFRSAAPDASFEQFRAYLARHLPGRPLTDSALRGLYERYAAERFSLADRGYLARVHPLALWVAAYLRRHPQASLAAVLEASRDERQAVYGWLFRTRARQAQDRRILSVLESDAFAEIHRGWRRLGYPFDSLVPSYATAIGSSGDRPAALAELAGILVHEGIRAPTVQLEQLRLAARTPYETVLRRRAGPGERVMAPEVAATLRQAMGLVVTHGTARRLGDALAAPDGRTPVVGGKTGTGDNRLERYGPKGALLGSRVVNRTATFVFFIDDRFFGTLTAYVPGPGAQAYRFTSALPVQIFKNLAPLLKPAVLAPAGAPCAPSPQPMAAKGHNRP